MSATNSYYVEYSAERADGTRIMSARWVDIIDGYTTEADIPSIVNAGTGHRDIVILRSTPRERLINR